MFVIRSMTTTDYRMAYRSGDVLVPEQKPVPYHIYLRKPHRRGSAFWAGKHEAMKFSTVDDAMFHGREILTKPYGDTRFEVVPENDANVTPYWQGTGDFPRTVLA